MWLAGADVLLFASAGVAQLLRGLVPWSGVSASPIGARILVFRRDLVVHRE
jgi:hypothetical protein